MSDDWNTLRKQVSVSQDQLDDLFRDVDRMRPVYDAAIALHVAEHQYRELFSIRNDEAGVTEEQRSALLRKLECEELFDRACRRAKEGT